MKVNEASFVDLKTLAAALNLSEVSHSILTASLSVYFLLIIILGGIGNTLIIYGVWIHNALKMERTSVLTLLYVAFADLACVIVFYVPRTITLLTGRWALGSAFCYTTLIRWIQIPCEQNFIALLSCHRAYLIWKPLQGGIRCTTMRNIMITVIFYFSLTYTLETLLVEGQGPELKFEPPMFDCTIDMVQIIHSSAKFIPYRGFILTFIPLIAIILANGLILGLMKKAGQTRRFHAVKTLSIVCWTFLASYIPCMSLWVLKGLAGSHTIQTPSDEIFIILRIATIMAIAINIVVNPFIYFYTNDKFAFFVREVLRGNVRNFGRRWQNHVDQPYLPSIGPLINITVPSM